MPRYLQLMLATACSCSFLLPADRISAGANDEAPSRAIVAIPQTIDRAIRADIEDAERFTSDTPEVTVESGMVTLSGTVASLQEKQIAADIAKRTRGVDAVLNLILVRRSDREDDAIKQDVDRVLRLNDSVSAPKVKTDVSNGEISLLGEVESPAISRIIEYVVSGIRGVTQVDNQLTVSLPVDRSDAELRDEISALIVQSVYFDDASIDVEVKDRVARLSGEVVSLAAKERLQRFAEIWGVASVNVDEVSVNPDAGDSSLRKQRYADVTDKEIKTAVKRLYRNDPILFSRTEHVQVAVKNKVLVLDGTVDRLWLKDRAERLANDVIGVRRINNDMEVQSAGDDPSDAEIIRDVQTAIRYSAYLTQREIRVHCQRSHVNLYGVVDSELEKQIAGYLASNVRGVVHVNNSLAIDRKPSGKDDQQIETDLRRKLKFALLDKSNQVDFNVENGVAILRGEVDTWRQWQAVMDLAIEAGAHHPHNLINVRLHPPHQRTDIFVPR